jgi:hypothetical protein
MSCSTSFVRECKWWNGYAIASLVVILIAGVIFESKNFAGWDLIAKVIIVWGVTTCVVWWAWTMKKIYDIAHWWYELHHHVHTATQLLQETKADIKDIKRLSASAS